MGAGAMARRSPLDDPRTAQHAWARYKRVMRWMGAFTLVIVLAALGYIYWRNGPVSIHLFIAAALGIGLTMLLMSALMGLVFLSSGTGHDELVSDWDEGDQDTAGRRR